MIVELRQPLCFETPRGKATAFFVIDYGTEASLIWVCFVVATGECWSFGNRDVRLERNQTSGMNPGPAPQV